MAEDLKWFKRSVLLALKMWTEGAAYQLNINEHAALQPESQPNTHNFPKQ